MKIYFNNKKEFLPNLQPPLKEPTCNLRFLQLGISPYSIQRNGKLNNLIIKRHIKANFPVKKTIHTSNRHCQKIHDSTRTKYRRWASSIRLSQNPQMLHIKFPPKTKTQINCITYLLMAMVLLN